MKISGCSSGSHTRDADAVVQQWEAYHGCRCCGAAAGGVLEMQMLWCSNEERTRDEDVVVQQWGLCIQAQIIGDDACAVVHAREALLHFCCCWDLLAEQLITQGHVPAYPASVCGYMVITPACLESMCRWFHPACPASVRVRTFSACVDVNSHAWMWNGTSLHVQDYGHMVIGPTYGQEQVRSRHASSTCTLATRCSRTEVLGGE
eukprot:1159473-Pelagomonas_calceolata.AAC.4